MSTEELFNELPSKITHEGRRYRLNITKSTKGACTLFYKPMHGGSAPLIHITDSSLSSVLKRAKIRLEERKKT